MFKFNKAFSVPFTILVEGNIGCGKSSFLEYFKSFDNIDLNFEPVEKWKALNLLELLYKDLTKWSFPFQSYVTLTMLKTHLKETKKPVKIMERSLFSARYCFIEAMLENETFHAGMYEVFQEWFDYIQESAKIRCDLIIYFQSSPEEIFKRIKNRGRSEELSINLDYLKLIHRCYEKWLIHKQKQVPSPILVLNADLNSDKILSEYKKAEKYIFQGKCQLIRQQNESMSQ